VHFGEALVFDAQLDAAGGVDFNDIDKLPGDGAGGDFAGDGLECGAGQKALEDATKGSAEADFDFGDAKQVSCAAAHPFQIDVVYADHLAAVNIDNLPVDEILRQIEVIALVFEGNKRAGGAQFKSTGGGFHDFLGGDDAEAGAGFEHQAGDFARVRAGGDSDVFETAAEVALGVSDRGAEQGGKTDASCGARLHEVEFIPSRRCSPSSGTSTDTWVERD